MALPLLQLCLTLLPGAVHHHCAPSLPLTRRCTPPRASAYESDGRPAAAADPQLPDSEELGALPSVGETLQLLHPQNVLVANRALSDPLPLPPLQGGVNFVSIFRSCTPYIKMHQSTTMVFHICSELLDEARIFDEFMSEVAILALLGVRPVLLVGTRQQVDRKIREAGREVRYAQGHRITDEAAIHAVREVSGFARSRVEGALARGKVGPTSGVGVDVVGGNFFFTAQPLGVRVGVDFGFTGEVRRVDDAKINYHLAHGEIVLLSSLGYSASGTVFNVRTEELASRVAAALGAAKLVYVTPGMLLKQDERCRIGDCVVSGTTVLQAMRLTEAKRFLAYYQPPSSSAGAPADADEEHPLLTDVLGERADPELSATMLHMCGECVYALERGVTRAHLLPPTPGALIQELYTADGMGTLITKDLYDGIRLATPADVPGIVELITPLELKGILITRDRGKLARDVHKGFYYVFTRDTLILGCANLKRYTPEMAELGCLVVEKAYQKQGVGDAMLCFLERTAIAAGVKVFFALSTHTMQWFIERGFAEVGLDFLPEARKKLYDPSRGSKIYKKELSSGRLVDAQELFWQPNARSKAEKRSR